MAAVASLNWSGDGESERDDGSGNVIKDKVQTWKIVDCTTSALALVATGLPIFDQELVPGSPYRVRAREVVTQDGPTSYTARITYGISDTGGGDPVGDPLLRDPVIEWGEAIIQHERQQDVKKKHIRNSVGLYFDPLPTKASNIETLTVTKYFPFYDRALRRRFVGKVNSTPFTIGLTTFLAREAKCVSIRPATSYTIRARYIPVAFTFELDNEDRATPGLSGYPFDAHIVDQSTRAWFRDTSDSNKIKLGWFCTTITEGGVERVLNIIDSPTLLNGNGGPIDTNIKVTDRPDGTGRVFSYYDRPEYQIDADHTSPFSSATTVMWRYPMCDEENFLDLPI